MKNEEKRADWAYSDWSEQAKKATAEPAADGQAPAHTTDGEDDGS
jgi:hypothetical protein